MNRDLSFIKFYTDFAQAKQSDNPPISKLNYQGFIQQKTNETFLQITNSNTPIVFVGGYTAELVDSCGNVKRDITEQFYFDGFVDNNGINQIEFEFGMIGQDFYTLPLHIKLTDVVNGNIWYSNSFCVTDYNSNISSRFDYYNETDTYKRSIRLANCYDHSPQNELSSKQYTTSYGNRVNYKNITTYLRKYLIDSLDFFVNDRLPELFNYNNLFVNGQRVSISDLKTDERKGDTNLLNAEFVVNPQNDFYNWDFQIYEGLQVVNKQPINGAFYSGATFDTFVSFNKNIDGLDGDIKLFKDGLFVTNATYTITDNVVDFEFTITFTNGNYSIVFPKANKGVEVFNGYAFNEWTFTIADGEYDDDDYDNNDYLT